VTPRPFGRLDSLLVILIAAIGLFAYLTPLGLAVLLPAATAALLAIARRERRLSVVRPWREQPFLWLLALFATLSALWAVVPGGALVEGLRLLAEIAIGLTAAREAAQLPAALRQRALLALAGGFAGAALLMLADLSVTGALTGWARHRLINGTTIANAYSRGADLHAVILAPLLIGLIRLRRHPWAALSLAIAVAAIYALHSASAKLALPLGLVIALAVYCWRGFGRLLVLAQCAAILAFPVIVQHLPDPASFCGLAEHQPSALHRLYIWRFVDRHIMERPLLGWGMDASRHLAGPQDKVTLYTCATSAHPRRKIETVGLLPLHPHNAVLQVWVELGLLGALLALAAILWLGWPLFAAARDRRGAASAAGTLAAASSAACISFGIWQPWWVAGFFFSALANRLIEAKAAGCDTPEAGTCQSIGNLQNLH
jgi:O-antigen ligase